MAPVIAGKEDKPRFMDSVINGCELMNTTSYEGEVLWLQYKQKGTEQ